MSSEDKMSMDEKRWRAESDARTLAEATVIKKDPSRFNAAKKAAQRMADEQMKEAKAIQQVARAKKRGK